jgi:hypothetical protein
MQMKENERVTEKERKKARKEDDDCGTDRQCKQMQTPLICVYSRPSNIPDSSMAATRPNRPKPLDWLGPSHQDVFIRNLKLLQLDRREDWPSISIRSLSASSQNQRQRIRLIEWALYYLFAIWDSEGTQNVHIPDISL